MRTIASVGAYPDDPPEDLADRSRLPDDVLELVAILELAREERDLTGEPAVVERLADFDEELLLGERLLDVVERTGAHRLDRALDRAVRGHDDDLGHRARAFDRTEDVDPVLRSHPEIGDEDVVGAGRSALRSFFAALRFVDPRSPRPATSCERRAHVALVIDDEELRHREPHIPRRTGHRKDWEKDSDTA